jgi:hypothetical protein
MDPNAAALPNYQDDEAAFALFLREHTILRAASADDALLDDDDDDDDLLLLEPTSEGKTLVRRVPCYPPPTSVGPRTGCRITTSRDWGGSGRS